MFFVHLIEKSSNKKNGKNKNLHNKQINQI